MSTEVIPGTRTEPSRLPDKKAELLRDWITTLLQVPGESVGWGKRRFRLGSYDYYGEGIAEDSIKLWLIRRPVKNPQGVEVNLWIYTGEEKGANPTVEYHSYNKKSRAKYRDGEIAIIKSQGVLGQVKKDLATSKSSKRA